MMRSRQQLREAVIKANEVPNLHDRAFKLSVIEIELLLDIRDYAEMIAKHFAKEEYDALKKSVDRQPRS